MTAKQKTTPTLTPAESAAAAEGWLPEPGDTVEGTVTHLTAIESDYGTYPMITLDTANGFFNIHAFHSVLLKQLTKLAPAPGSQLRIVFHGKVTPKSGDRQPYYSYTATDPTRAVETFSWDTAGDGAAF